MKLDEITSEQEQQKLDEILPVLGAVAGGVARGAMALGKSAVQGVGTAAKTVGGAVTQGVKALGQPAQAGGMAGGEEDPAAQAQQIAAAKKEVQDQIKAKQQELQQLQQQLAQIK